ncbi:MAG TPA: PhzF family phenazine biosynthesis protein [Bauldia sp.]|nr:PhzF family phenazine biosynthesis protein [Bauldia sp.]
MTRRYAILDVFTDRPLAGNPLAVVLDGDGLDDGAMQAIAREFNLSETVFVTAPAEPRHSAAVRIFTTAREMPFAGHPTVGAAVLLAARPRGGRPVRPETMLVLEEKVGPVRCGVTLREDAGGGHAIFDLPKLPEEAGKPPSDDMIAAALGLTPAEIGFENHRPGIYSAGVRYTFVPVRDLSVIGRAAPGLGWGQAFGDLGNAFLYCRETTAGGRHFHARMFGSALGSVEDPATGSAVAAFAGVIHRFDEPTEGQHRFVIEQGFEMGRPSILVLEMDVENGKLVSGRIGGDAVVVGEGTLSL